MKYYLNLAFRLMLIAAVASGVLAFVNSKTAPMIADNLKNEEINARKEVLPEAAEFVAESIKLAQKKANDEEMNPFVMQEESADNSFQYYKGINQSGEIIGYTFVAKKYGYSSEIKTMVGVTPDLNVKNIKIIFQSETPGLGANCENPSFPDEFKGKSEEQMYVDKDGGNIASITGATITTRAIANSIKDGLGALKIALAKEGK